ncbi:tRNA (N(6)-L-threonylcarbamoyladenosine(37)-C(2))-methylthiotransferase MtaB [Anaerosporobacter faecicola]|uniref:tRNA (N(6)-L-threonylcarbamoyladenosine(37)-C(2))- methylthiotransferase MtaB n=1 Tax=Anaerosporobacter faecicola TaxID=2718714 RepID=UPI00143B6E5E|nr:tRNA (N(6)-L-threonylcarbamoyladenosine(37)-C(2))-methylthiotransferase MtaB [Anaerosporobacter faecicola]
MENQIKQPLENRKVAFLTLGCKVNSYETEAMEQLFQQASYTIVDFAEQADIYVVNTCTVTNIADRKSRQMLHKAKKLNPDAVVVAVGCYVQAAKDALEADEAIDLVVGNNQKKQIVQLLENYLSDHEENEAVIDIAQDSEYEELAIGSLAEKTRAYMKIQDGCNQFCSYCIIPYTRGRIRSRKKEDILAEVHRLVNKGYKEIVLTGIHLSSYGLDSASVEEYDQAIDQAQHTPLLQIITEISEVDGVERIRLGSLEPRIITDEFVKTLSKNSKFCPHFHLSLQSGCDATLKRMNRKYDTKLFMEKCEQLREHFDRPALTTDVIVGFPGETEEEFGETIQFLKKITFMKTHVFKYSKRQGTRAAAMENQIAESIKHERSETLIELDKKNNHMYLESFIGENEKVLFEERVTIDGKEYMVGHTQRYVKVAVEGEESLVNQIVPVVIDGFASEEVLHAFMNYSK